MSWGYVPKKLKRQRRYRLLRKKYKNFSCKTCRIANVCRKGLYWRTSGFGLVQFCPDWKAFKVKKKENNTTTCSEKKGFFKHLFK